MDGVELTKAIRQLGYSTPVIWFTALDVPNMAERAERLAVYCCLYKPLQVDEMRQAVANVLEDPQKESTH
jgi:DNA-binding NtrC family response regulator